MCPRRYKNWALNDFLILRRKRIKMSTKAKYAVRSLKNLLPDLSWTQIKRDSGAIGTVVVLICTILGMGWYLRFHLKHAYVPVPRPQPESMNARIHVGIRRYSLLHACVARYSGWFGSLAMLTLLLTFLLFKAWFNTFHFPFYPCGGLLGVFIATGLLWSHYDFHMWIFYAGAVRTGCEPHTVPAFRLLNAP